MESEMSPEAERVLQLCSEWEARSEKEEREYKFWLPEFHEKVAQAKGGFFALLYAYCNADKDNDLENGVYRCLYPLRPIPHGGVALVTRDAETLEREVQRFLAELRHRYL